MSRAALRVAMVAGEASGDLLGSRVIAALRRACPDRDLQLEGIGGPAMAAEGFSSLYPMERLAVMGLVEPLKRLPELLRMRGQLRQRFTAAPPDFFLGIDAPDFNLPLSRKLKASGVPTAQLVSPTVWAWRAGRVHSVARSVDRLLCLFPFEPELYQEVAVEALFVGHPLVRELATVPDRAQARTALGIEGEGPLIALLPGSRATEVSQLAPTLLRAAGLLHGRDARRRFLLPAAGEERFVQCEKLIREHASGLPVTLLQGQSREAMLAADVVLLASGTAAFEAMLLERPMVISYRVAPLSWSILSRMAVTRFVGLPNVFAGEAVVPELLQEDLTPTALALEAETLLREGAAQVAALAPFRAALERDFDRAVADALLPLCADA